MVSLGLSLLRTICLEGIKEASVPLQPVLNDPTPITNVYDSMSITWSLPSTTGSALSSLSTGYEIRYRNAYVDDGAGSRNWVMAEWTNTLLQQRLDDLPVVPILNNTNGSMYDFGFWIEVQVRSINADGIEGLDRSPWSVSRFFNLAPLPKPNSLIIRCMGSPLLCFTVAT